VQTPLQDALQAVETYTTFPKYTRLIFHAFSRHLRAGRRKTRLTGGGKDR